MSDAEWQVIEPALPAPGEEDRNGRPPCGMLPPRLSRRLARQQAAPADSPP
jgi:hypothetical protein